LRPDRWDVVLDKLHEQTGLDKTFLKDFMKFYWKKVREHIVNTKHYCLEIKGLGTMIMINTRAETLKEKYENILQTYPVNTIGMFKRKQRIEDTVNNLKHAIETYKQDKEKFIKVMEKRYGKYTPNLEKQKKYTGRY
jgi:hypothetical protein